MSICFNNKIDIKSLNLIKNELFKNCLVYLGFDYEQQIVKPEQTNKQRDREFNYRGHSYPLWIVRGSGPKADENCVKDSKKHKKISTSDTILKTADREAFVTLKDHKESFDQDPNCRLLNPTKPEMGRVAKQILHKN